MEQQKRKIEAVAGAGTAVAGDAAKQEAMEIAEAAREKEWKDPSFASELFNGRFMPELIFPYPRQGQEDKAAGDAFIAKLEPFLREKLDADEVDRTGILPESVVKGLFEIGAFSMKIPKEYGGQGFSQTNYNRAIQMVASHCATTAVWLSAHQSIGVPQPLKLFGTPEQKKKYMPRLAKGELSAFALTEPNVGSDPAKMETVATPTEDGNYVLNGEKLWCTNGTKADILIVMARTPSKMEGGREKKQITAFIVERNWPGFEVGHRCDFMGLKGIQNGVLRFKNVKVPKENILWGPGLGLKLALITLNTGRLTVPSACTGVAKRCLKIVREWANARVQWGAPVGKHEAVAVKIGYIASHTFAMEAVSELGALLADKGSYDIRLEAAISKMFCTETCWNIIDETMQVRGGRGYETANSLKARGGERPEPVERFFRDGRINTIIEGTSEIMRLFIAREALDPHMRVAGAMANPKATFGEKAAAFPGMAAHYMTWLPRQFVNGEWFPGYGELGTLSGHFWYVGRTSHRLARKIFYAMAKYQAGLERKQRTLGRLVNIGADLFAMSATCARAHREVVANPADKTPIELADLFCKYARRRIENEFKSVFNNDDADSYKVARGVLDGRYTWLEKGALHTP